jgi:PAS domain S-box-containing protein
MRQHGVLTAQGMNEHLHILHLEDDQDYADLIRELLAREGIEASIQLVSTRADFDNALDSKSFDAILADYTLPEWNGIQALHLARKKSPDTPFLLVSGTVGEQIAIESLRGGATDYVLKNYPERLAPALQRAMREKHERLRRENVERQATVLARLGQRLNCVTRPDEAAQVILNCADEMFGLDVFVLDLYDAAQDVMRPVLNVDVINGVRSEVRVTGRVHKPSPRACRVMAHGRELILRRLDAECAKDASMFGDSTRPSECVMVAPLRDGDRVIGVISIQSYSPDAYTASDLDGFQTLVDYCGGALQRIRAGQVVRESEQQFEDLFEGSPDGILVQDMEGRILDANPAACQMHGARREELVGRRSMDLVPEAGRAAAADLFRKLASEEIAQAECECWTLAGKATPVEIRSGRIPYRGRPAVLLHVRDVSNQKRLEEQFRQAQKMEAIGQLAGGVAHDFNNLLTVIHGHASLLLADARTPEAAASTQQIVEAVNRAATLTKQLLAFSRRQVLETRRLDVNDVVAQMGAMLSRIVGEQVALRVRYSPSPAHVQADRGMLEQILLNFFVNARDAMPDGGQLNVVIAEALVDAEHIARQPQARMGRFACLSVSDTGTGIPPEVLPRIFEPFFTTKEVGKGTGLGLATVYGIVKQHHGWIEVDTQQGRGTTFRVYLPALDEAVREQQVKSPEAVAGGGNETILIVEDEKPVRELVSTLLRRRGYRVLEAESGQKALGVWSENKGNVDLVLTDMVMPDRMSGWELAERLQAERPGLKVIFTSGYSAEVVGREFSLQVGVNYLPKPYHPQSLARAIRDRLDAPAAK